MPLRRGIAAPKLRWLMHPLGPARSVCARATHQLLWWHVKVTVGVSRGCLRTLQSMSFSAIICTYCSGALVRCTRWSISSGVRLSSLPCTLSLRSVRCPTASSNVSVTAARPLVASVMTSSVRPSTMKCCPPARVVRRLAVGFMLRCSRALLGSFGSAGRGSRAPRHASGSRVLPVSGSCVPPPCVGFGVGGRLGLECTPPSGIHPWHPVPC